MFLRFRTKVSLYFYTGKLGLLGFEVFGLSPGRETPVFMKKDDKGNKRRECVRCNDGDRLGQLAALGNRSEIPEAGQRRHFSEEKQSTTLNQDSLV